MKQCAVSVAGAAIILLSLSSNALANTTVASATFNSRTVSVGSLNQVVRGLVSTDSGNPTEFMPTAVVIDGLRAIGYSAKWIPSIQSLDIQVPATRKSVVNSARAAKGQAVIRVNGTVVAYAPVVVLPDPSTHAVTTYLPVVVLDRVFGWTGLTTSYNGATWEVSDPASGISHVTRIADLAISYVNPSAGNPVVISGVAEDATGHPVPHAQLLMTGSNDPDKDGINTNSYVVGSTVIPFPNATAAQGLPANSQLGIPITADATGHFRANVVNYQVARDLYSLWPVANGVVASNLPLNSSAKKGYSVALAWTNAKNLARIATYGMIPSSVRPDDPTNLANVSTEEGKSATVYFAPVSTTGPVTGQSNSYNLSASNGGEITSIDGVQLNSPAARATLTVQYRAGTYTLAVPGGFTDAQGKSASTITLTAGVPDTYDVYAKTIDQSPPMPFNTSGADPELFSVTIASSATGSTVVRASSGSISASQEIGVSVGPINQIGSVSPATGVVASGGITTVAFTVEDASGNPVQNTLVPISVSGHLAPLWITAINGVTLATTGSNGSQPTPIPLYEPNGWLGSGDTVEGPYTWVEIPGLIGDTSVGTSGTATIDAYTNARGQITLTLQDGNVTYYDSANATGTKTSDSTVNGSGTLYIGSIGSAAQGNFTVALSDSALPTNEGQIRYAQ